MKPFDTNGVFLPATGRLQRLAVRGAAATLFSSGLGLVIQVVATVVLARLLTPADFGLVAMVTTFSLLLSNFGFNGLTEAIIQTEELNEALASNLFWINVGSGSLLTAGFAASGSLMAWLYGNPLIEEAAIGVSPAILLSSTWVLHTALLKRAMRFSAVSANEIFARAISVVVSILLAWAHFGHWALVGGVIALPLSTTLGAWFLCRWIPRMPQRAPGTGSMLRFAINVYGRFTLNYFARNLDNLLVGWRFNAQSLGFYKRAYDLFALSAVQLTAPLTVVAVSALSRLNSDPTQYKRYLLSALGVVSFVGMALGAGLTLVGNDVIRLLLGPGWEISGRIFTFFGPGIGIMLLYGTNSWIHLSIGRPDRWFRWGLVEFALTASLFFLALPWGPVGIAIAWTVSFWILTIPGLWYAGRPIKFDVRPVIVMVVKYVVASVLAGCISAVIVQRFPAYLSASGAIEAFARIALTSVVFGILYLIAVIVLHRGCAPLYQVAGVLREIVPLGRLSKLLPARPTSSRTDASGVLP